MPKQVRKMQKANAAAQAAVLPNILPELLEQLIKGPMTAEAVEDVSRAFKKALNERALGVEMSHHLGYAVRPEKREMGTNHRNGRSGKTALTNDGPLCIEVPRDCEGKFEPQADRQACARFTGFDNKIIAMYARGMTVREIQGFLAEMYATDVTPDFISTVTDLVLAEIILWQSRPLEPMYPVIFFDALGVKIREDNVVRNKAVYLALVVCLDGTRDILGLWIENTEGAKFWMNVFNDLKTPAELYSASPTPYRGLPLLTYSLHDRECSSTPAAASACTANASALHTSWRVSASASRKSTRALGS
jgi:putative transposase